MVADCGTTINDDEKTRTPDVPSHRPRTRQGEEELLIEHAAVIETSITLQQGGKYSVSKHDITHYREESVALGRTATITG
jgi:hypothetical protein